MSVLKKKDGNLVLIGMPGAGKSTVGVVLAKNMGLRFLDSDLCIQEQESRRLHEIIAEDGLDAFLEIENRMNASLQVQNSVIATGGSVIYGQDAMEHLAEIGTIIYLKLPYEEIENRRLHAGCSAGGFCRSVVCGDPPGTGAALYAGAEPAQPGQV